MKKLLYLIVFIVCASCAPKPYTGIQAYVKRDGEIGFTERKFWSLDQCQRKSKRIARRRARFKDHNPNYGITVMGGARQRR